MKISFAITVCNEIEEIKRLVPFLLKHKRPKDEIVVLFDQKNGDQNVIDYLLPFNKLPNVQTWRGFDFNNNFADWKNKLNEYCNGDYIVSIDADEMISEYMIKNVSEIISMNPDVDLYYVPRINTVDGITEEHIKKWNWVVDHKNRINHPDYQGRIFRKGLMWSGNVHERIVGFSKYSLLPTEEELYSIQHHKTISKQETQNKLYETII
jgi:glycosyltransferase involved in cell wall biosynthesis